jgi:aldehyde:ferredoxin oxidoreductase
MSSQYGGWTGKTLTVNLSTATVGTPVDAINSPTAAIGTVDTVAKYKDYLGGTGIGYKVLWDQVPPGTKAFDPANAIVFAVGPITGTGAPSAGRTSITFISPYTYQNDLPAAGHMGGHFGPEFKYAGYDAIIITGAAAQPVWLQIVDNMVTVMDASQMWGNGTTAATDQICTAMGSTAQVAAIGQIGELGAQANAHYTLPTQTTPPSVPLPTTLGRLSCIINDRCHCGGAGSGAVMGSKYLKAIGVTGTGSVPIATDSASWKTLISYYLSLIGANNNHIVPKVPQPWAAYSDSGSRWSADKGVYWGAAMPELETGYCTAYDKPLPVDCPVPQNKMGLRTQKGFNDMGIAGMNHTVKMNGCHGCPIRCHISTDVEALEQYDISRYNEETCIGYTPMSSMYNNAAGTDGTVIMDNITANLCNDFGLWTDYGNYSALYGYCWTHVMTAAEVAYLQNPTALDPEFAKVPPIPANGLNVNGLPYVGRTPFQNNLPAAELTILGGANCATMTWAQLIAANPPATGSPNPYAAGTPWGNCQAGIPYGVQQLMYLFAGKPAASSSGSTTAPAVVQTVCPTLQNVITNGPPAWSLLWPEVMFYCRHNKGGTVFKMGHMKHHGVESFGQIGVLINTMFNRDPMNHTHQNITVALPLAMRNTLMAGICGPSGQSTFTGTGTILYDGSVTPYSPMTTAMVAFAAASTISVEIKNAMVHCDWMFPTWMSPLASGPAGNGQAYTGDFTIESKIYKAVTGDTPPGKPGQDMELIGLRNLTLFRCLNASFMNYWYQKANGAGTNINMLTQHDQPNPWMFETAASPVNVAAGTTSASWTYPATYLALQGNIASQLMDPTDMAKALQTYHNFFGWNATTGMPTATTLSNLGLSYVTTPSAAGNNVSALIV